MSAGNVQQVDVDVLPPLPNDAHTSGAATGKPALPDHSVPFDGLRTFYHPASGVAILMLDWFAFGTDFFTGFLALPVVCVLAFLVSFPLVFVIQRKWTKDSASAALGKAFLGAFMVGLPFPITGTMLGAAILALSGLSHHPIEMVRKLAEKSSAARQQ
jgi:uncharacterized membrane protein